MLDIDDYYCDHDDIYGVNQCLLVMIHTDS